MYKGLQTQKILAFTLSRSGSYWMICGSGATQSDLCLKKIIQADILKTDGKGQQ